MNSKNYGITIKDMAQPILIHPPKKRSKQGGKIQIFCRTRLLTLTHPTTLKQKATLWGESVLGLISTYSVFIALTGVLLSHMLYK
jgi:hypothetical protein